MGKFLSKKGRVFLIIICVVILAIIFFSTGAKAQKKPNIVIIATGGTIAGVAADKTQVAGYKAGALGIQALIDAVPEIKNIAEIDGEQLVSIDSQNMNESIWIKLSNRINTLLSSSNVDGIVVTHGTDTMEETSYFMNLTVKSSKPIVFVGAMRPATAMSADGPLNLYNAVKIAASQSSKGRGVVIAMNETIFSARFATKGNTTSVATFIAPNQGALGYIQNGRVIYYNTSLRIHTSNSKMTLPKEETLPRVDIIYAFAGIPKDYVDHALQSGAKGIVVAGMGDGGLGTILINSLSEASKKGVVIVRSNRTGSGIVTRNGDAEDDKLNFVVADDLNPQKARVLLQLALLQSQNPKTIQDIFMSY